MAAWESIYQLLQIRQESASGSRPRTAAAGGRPQAGLEFVEKLLTKLTSTDTTGRNASMLRRVPPRRIAGRAGYCS
jgi:hypothetical protein